MKEKYAVIFNLDLNMRTMKEIVCSVIVLLGIDLSVSSITSDLKSYKDNNINRYVIRDELLGNILDDYFDVIIVGEVSEITKSVVLGKPFVCG